MIAAVNRGFGAFEPLGDTRSPVVSDRLHQLPKSRGPSIECSQRLGGLLKYYHRRPA